MQRFIALLLSASVAFPGAAHAQEKDEDELEIPPSEWPDAGSEEPEGAKVFPIDPTEKRSAIETTKIEIPKEIAEPTYRWSWYGWRNLIGDGLATILLISSPLSQRFEVAIAGAAVYAIAGPIAHFTAGNWGRALISFGMRLAGPAIFGLGAFAVVRATDSDDDVGFILILLGTFAGGFIAAGLDAGLVARHKIPVEPKITLVPNGPKTFGLAFDF